jgi:hypothetical protein
VQGANAMAILYAPNSFAMPDLFDDRTKICQEGELNGHQRHFSVQLKLRLAFFLSIRLISFSSA